MNLVELQFLNFIEPPAPHALNRDSTEVEIPPTNSILSESNCHYVEEEFWSSGWWKVFWTAQYQVAIIHACKS